MSGIIEHKERFMKEIKKECPKCGKFSLTIRPKQTKELKLLFLKCEEWEKCGFNQVVTDISEIESKVDSMDKLLRSK